MKIRALIPWSIDEDTVIARDAIITWPMGVTEVERTTVGIVIEWDFTLVDSISGAIGGVPL